jgi:inosine-uridine nucleoside N-ribohydrolase
VVLDVDTGIDDALALVYAARSPDLDLVGVTTCFGNGDIHTTTRNTLAVLELAGADVPVHQGADRPLVGEWHASAEAFHGSNGMGEAQVPEPRRRPASLEAAAFLVDAARRHCGSLVIVATARLTNLAAALAVEPRLASWVQRIVVMGGAAFVPGNVTAAAEANIWGDPEAAWRVFHSGAPLTLVGLDVTHQALLRDGDLDRLDPALPYAALMREAVEFYMRAYNPDLPPGRRSCPLHDPLAVALAEDPSLAEYETLPVDVELHGTLTRGATIVDARPYRTAPPNAAVALRLHHEAFRRRFLEHLGAAEP